MDRTSLFIHGTPFFTWKKDWCINYCYPDFGSVQFSHSAMSDSLWPHESQHAKPHCPSPTPGVHSDSRPSSQWCYPATSSCRPLLLAPPNPPSIRVFSNESTLCMRWTKYWSFSSRIIPSKEIPGLISFRTDCGSFPKKETDPVGSRKKIDDSICHQW